MTDLVFLAQNVLAALPAADAAADAAGLSNIGKGIAYGAAASGAGIGIGLVIASTITGIARQPEQANTLRGLMFLGVGFIEALALIGFVLVFLIK
ncbi:hypothetical protein LBMAG53_04640 [Planctomycetota bacterium]|nr:hypothetical protein LBMAG53_04640 [Planctomycetota bacterium]